MYPHQFERLTAALERAGLDALVASTPANLDYVTGFRSLLPADTPGAERYGVFTRSGTALVVSVADAVTAAIDGIGVDHVRCHGPALLAEPRRADEAGRRVHEWTRELWPDGPGAVAAALRALGVDSGRIGVDEAGLRAAAWRGLVAGLSGLEVVEAATALADARSVKGPWEIECLQRALHTAEAAANEVIQVLAPGMTERDAVARFRDVVLARGGEPRGIVVLFGERTGVPAAAPSDRTLRAGELVRIDGGCVLKGYHGRLARSAVTDQVSDEQQSTYDAVQAALEAALETVRPGATVGVLVERAVSAARKGGLSGYERTMIGGGIGLEAREFPEVAAGSEDCLQTGMVITLETSFYELGWGGLNLRDTVLVTRDGYASMNRASRGLVVLD